MATWRKMNGDNEIWTVACGLTFKLILSSCQFRKWPRLPVSKGGTDHREKRENKWVERVVVRGRTCQDSQMNEGGERVFKLKRWERRK